MSLDLNNLVNISKLVLGVLNDVIILSDKGSLIYSSSKFYKSSAENQRFLKIVNLLSPISNYFTGDDSIKSFNTSKTQLFFLQKHGYIFIHIINKHLFQEYDYSFDHKIINEKLETLSNFLLFLSSPTMLNSSNNFNDHIQEQIANFLINLETSISTRLNLLKNKEFLHTKYFSSKTKSHIRKCLTSPGIYTVLIFNKHTVVDVIAVEYCPSIKEINYSISIIQNNNLKKSHSLSSFPIHLKSKTPDFFSGLCYFYSKIYKLSFIYLTNTAYFDLAVLAEIQLRLINNLTKVRFFSKLKILTGNSQIFFIEGMLLLYSVIIDLERRTLKEYQKEGKGEELMDDKIRINNILLSMVGEWFGENKVVKLRNGSRNVCIHRKKDFVYVMIMEGCKEYKINDLLKTLNEREHEIFTKI